MQTSIDVISKLKADNSERQTPPPPPPQITPSTLIFFTIAVLVFCFVGFCVLFFCRCCFVNISNSTTLVHLSTNASPYRGLDLSLLQAFPTFLYSTVKDLRKENNYSLECAICLLEFDNDSMLRLLTLCYHVFHQDCIDLWLRSHKTCPVCRTDLEAPTNKDVEQNQENVEPESIDHVCIDVKEGDGDHRHVDDEGVSSLSDGMQQHKFAFARSHSTGHSIVMVRGEGREDDDDKYTLRLQEHVSLEIVKGGHNYSKSCSASKDMSRFSAPCRNCGYLPTLFDTSSSNNAIKNNI
ncbi:hypothetical protein VNO78_08827 [Psophocarpus tetragonolobus]|uniref:RING-type E3 ubiquitin transferase n=1 Tax=Psophocarpus tetragonolobus TaxID=3891 RepID=A0AAN9SYM5_PSOTE